MTSGILDALLSRQPWIEEIDASIALKVGRDGFPVIPVNAMQTDEYGR
jgi:hypothetical protein